VDTFWFNRFGRIDFALLFKVLGLSPPWALAVECFPLLSRSFVLVLPIVYTLWYLRTHGGVFAHRLLLPFTFDDIGLFSCKIYIVTYHNIHGLFAVASRIPERSGGPSCLESR
jgi:hypothetical protein